MRDSDVKGLACRGVRGAICVGENEKGAIIEASARLLRLLLTANDIEAEDLASIFFTATPDLDAAFPAAGAADMGLDDVALLCAQEIGAEAPIARCIRILMHWNTSKKATEIKHVYIGEAALLRPERALSPEEEA
ncbi:MAG: chorismate mutase [Deltaproteobacteria bacterium]|nr:chorismate mutase [Deltaproteobacteria bacterium]